MTISLTAIPNLPEVTPGTKIGALLVSALRANGMALAAHDVVVIAQKIVSKAENRYAYLDEVVVSQRAEEVAEQTDKDPRLVELILQESSEISRMRKGVLIVRHRLGFVSANAGIDRSNVAQDDKGERVLLLPIAPDVSAEFIHQHLQDTFKVPLGVVITDSHGRPHRLGTSGVAIGVAGIPALLDKRGEKDRYGYVLQYTDIGIADELAAAASLLMGQAAESTPVIIVRGLQLPTADGHAKDLYRPMTQDLYR